MSKIVSAIAVKRGKAWSGVLDGDVFAPEEELESIEMPEEYSPMVDYLLLKNPKMTKKEAEDIRKSTGYTKVYVFMGEEDDDFWSHYNRKCMTCKRKCKQSSKVQIFCPLYEEKK